MSDTLKWEPLERRCRECSSAVIFACVNGEENIAKYPRAEYVAKCTTQGCVNNTIVTPYFPSAPPDWCVRV